MSRLSPSPAWRGKAGMQASRSAKIIAASAPASARLRSPPPQPSPASGGGSLAPNCDDDRFTAAPRLPGLLNVAAWRRRPCRACLLPPLCGGRPGWGRVGARRSTPRRRLQVRGSVRPQPSPPPPAEEGAEHDALACPSRDCLGSPGAAIARLRPAAAGRRLPARPQAVPSCSPWLPSSSSSRARAGAFRTGNSALPRGFSDGREAVDDTRRGRCDQARPVHDAGTRRRRLPEGARVRGAAAA
jgi:hypothetical protein